MTAGIAAAARRLFPPGVAVAVLDPRAPHPGLLPEEAPAIAGAVPRRRLEFAAGRAAARAAMAALGLPGHPVPSGPDRAPAWPDGIVGSIAHTGTCCIAVAALATRARSLGVDVEPAVPLPPDLAPAVCTPSELAWLRARPEARRGLLATLVFSAKECAYKCKYPLIRSLLGFDALRVQLDLSAGTWRAVFLLSVPPFAAGEALMGRFEIGQDVILTATILPRDRPRTGF